MEILFSTKLTDDQREYLKRKYPAQSFHFFKNMEQAKAFLPTADVLVTYGGDLNRELIQEAKQLKWIMLFSAGMDDMPLKEIEEADIILTNVRGIHKVPMAEYAISMLLQVYRQEKTLVKNENEHKWEKSLRMNEISGKTMLIAGTGAIGQEVARLAKAFRMKTVGVSRSGRKVDYFDENHANTDLKKLLPEADFLVSVMPSTRETYHFYTMEHFKLMPEHAVFLNMGRGDAVGTDVLLEAVRNHEIAHAVLDVFEQEPLPEDSPLWNERNVTLTPHLSGVSPAYMTRALEIFDHNLEAYLRDDQENMQNKIDVSRGY
ncbi:D-2-hydroxyacid dehydrogenase [Virgibacillus halophilus]|uniref:D-2-hydroxyacid dehydrogenase n=1 Tax=Tigheibacillus halophilus TaxID=361280 RepID=A0ABU5C907_9BACI|nr:D-2-hydroxyacid dehydrogenase [Virgibacillus halophilus]